MSCTPWADHPPVRLLQVLAAAATTAALTAPAAAGAAETGGASPPRAQAAQAATGGASPDHLRGRPVARELRATPGRVTAPVLPRVRMRVDHASAPRVSARLVILERGGDDAVARVDLGRLHTGERVIRRLPRATELPPGTYTVRLHVKDDRGRTLRRTRRASGKTTLVVRSAPRPTEPRPPAPSPGRGPYAFPIAGAYAYAGPGGSFGADRGTYSHQGQDLSAAAGTPVVAPIAGTVRQTANQEAGAGEYVVLDGNDGRSYFFAHCALGSTAVQVGQRVVRAARLCGVGSTGRSSGPHLHFEIWTPGWRTPGSTPIDPGPILRAWEQGRRA